MSLLKEFHGKDTPFVIGLPSMSWFRPEVLSGVPLRCGRVLLLDEIHETELVESGSSTPFDASFALLSRLTSIQGFRWTMFVKRAKDINPNPVTGNVRLERLKATRSLSEHLEGAICTSNILDTGTNKLWMSFTLPIEDLLHKSFSTQAGGKSFEAEDVVFVASEIIVGLSRELLSKTISSNGSWNFETFEALLGVDGLIARYLRKNDTHSASYFAVVCPSHLKEQVSRNISSKKP